MMRRSDLNSRQSKPRVHHLVSKRSSNPAYRFPQSCIQLLVLAINCTFGGNAAPLRRISEILHPAACNTNQANQLFWDVNDHDFKQTSCGVFTCWALARM